MSDRNDVEPVIQILPESPVLDGLFQIPVRRGNHPHLWRGAFWFPRRVHIPSPATTAAAWAGSPAANPRSRPETACRRPPARFFPACHCRAGERALHMAEQFALQQLPGQARATHRHKRVFLLRTAFMNRAGKHPFSRAAFAQQQNGRGGRGGLERQLQCLLHRRLCRGQVGRRGVSRNAGFQFRHAVSGAGGPR